MIVLLLAYLGGVVTIVSPCILPVLPFVFSRADRPFMRNGAPMLLGMTSTFAVVASLAVATGNWAVQANRWGRIAALALLALFGLALLFPVSSARVLQPLATLGGRLAVAANARGGNATTGTSLLLGAATGLLWAPCAGPILGLILTSAALNGANAYTSLLLFMFALGAATSLAFALLAGARVFAAMRHSLRAVEWMRRALGAAVLVAVASIALGLDTGVLTRVSVASTNALEQRLLDALHVTRANTPGATAAGERRDPAAGAEGVAPPLTGAVTWLNSEPLTMEALRGKVVLIDFWTYSCINCLRAIPYVRAWAEKYRRHGLVVIGVHSPEFAFEKNIGNVRRASENLGITYPVAIDNEFTIWRAYGNEYWPAHYFIDARGRIRHRHFGEGAYDQSERVIQTLLAEAGATAPDGLVAVRAAGAQAASARDQVFSPETYIGYVRAKNFASPGGTVRNIRSTYATSPLHLNEWALTGSWTIGPEHATLDEAGGSIVYRFHARDLHLVLGPRPAAAPVRFRITIDGAAPRADRGTDVDAAGEGVVTEQRLYQLIRQQGTVEDRTFEIRFLDPGVEAYAFTFG